MPHVAILAESLGAGGTERVITTLASGLTLSGYRVDIVIFTPVCACPQDIPEDVRVLVPCDLKKWMMHLPSIPIDKIAIQWVNTRKPSYKFLRTKAALMAKLLSWPLQIPSRRGLDRGVHLYHYMQHEKPDILIVNQRLPEYASYYSKKLYQEKMFPPVISIYHSVEGSEGRPEQSTNLENLPYIGTAINKLSTRARRQKVLVSTSDHVIAVSNGVKESLINACGISNENLSTIYNPMDISAIRRRSKERAEHAWFNDNGAPIILGVGRFTRQKDFHALIDAFQLTLCHRPCRLVILGDGPQRVELENKVKSLSLEPYVSLPGWVENPWSYMSRSALFVLSSRYEALPTVLIEALICGCKSVATKCPGGAAEILGNSSLLAPLDNPKALAKVMLEELERQVTQSEFEKKILKFSTEQIVPQYENIINKFIDNHT